MPVSDLPASAPIATSTGAIGMRAMVTTVGAGKLRSAIADPTAMWSCVMNVVATRTNQQKGPRQHEPGPPHLVVFLIKHGRFVSHHGRVVPPAIAPVNGRRLSSFR
jgi:hypothetical protein